MKFKSTLTQAQRDAFDKEERDYTEEIVIRFFDEAEATAKMKHRFLGRTTDECFEMVMSGACIMYHEAATGWTTPHYREIFKREFATRSRKYYIEELSMVGILFPEKYSLVRFESWLTERGISYRRNGYAGGQCRYLVDAGHTYDEYNPKVKIKPDPNHSPL